MNLLFILEENEPGPSGVVSVVKNQIKNWKKSDFIYVVINKNHWAYNELRRIKRKNFKIIKLKFKISDEINFNIKNKINFDLLYKLFRLFLIPIEFFYNIRLFFYLRNIIKKNNIYAILSHNGGWPGGILNRISILSSIFTNKYKALIIHNFPSKKKYYNFFLLNFNNLLIKALNIKIITVSESCKQDLINSCGFKKVKVIYNGLSPKINKFKNIKSKLEKIRLNYFGKIQYRKGLHLLIQALNNIKSNSIILNIYGDGDRNYKESIKLLKNNDNFILKFNKPIEDITKVLNETDIVILPSIEFESFGMVLIESMRQKVPIICSNSGGITEVVKNNENGLIFKSNNVKDLKKKLEILIGSKSLRIKLGKKGYKIFKKKFTNKKFIKEYEKLIYGK